MRKDQLPESKILDLVQQFNENIKDTIIGPNCIDPSICRGDCCFVNMDIPRALAEYYITHNLANPSCFLRGSRFAFRIRMDLETCKCVFFDSQLNGCSLHVSGMKTPQCWVYPTGLDPDSCETSCKKAAGWKIDKPASAIEANSILSDYVELCKTEAKLENTEEKIIDRLKAGFDLIYPNFPPYKIAGIQDGWNAFHILEGEGYSISMKQFCSQIPCEEEFFTCTQICPKAWQKVQNFLVQILPSYVKSEGFKDTYTFVELFHYQSKR